MDIAPPASMADVLEIAKRFTAEDPNGSGAADTIGLAVTKDLWGAIAGLQGFFNGYHAYPGIWFEKDGQLQYGSVQPKCATRCWRCKACMPAARSTASSASRTSTRSARPSRRQVRHGVRRLVEPVPAAPTEPAEQPGRFLDCVSASFRRQPAGPKPVPYRCRLFPRRQRVIRPPGSFSPLVNFWTENIVRSEDQAIRDTFLGTIDAPDIVLYKYIMTQIWEPNAMLRGGRVLRDAWPGATPAA